MNREWGGGAWRCHSVYVDIPYFLGLYAAADSAGGTDEAGGDFRFHAR